MTLVLFVFFISNLVNIKHILNYKYSLFNDNIVFFSKKLINDEPFLTYCRCGLYVL